MKKDELREYIRNLKPVFVRDSETSETESQYTVENFIQKFGIVTDRELAKDLLCINPLAWDVLSLRLKKDPEINLYHQPLGIITFERPINGRATIPVKCGDSFVMDTMNCPCVPKGFITRTDGTNFLAIPEDLPEDFDFEFSMRYIDIQRELIERAEVAPISNIVFMNGKEFNTRTFEKIFGMPLDTRTIFSSGAKMPVYNTELLKTIVPKYYEPNTK